MSEIKTGAVLVAGAGISGIQASLDLADSGYVVYLLENRSAIGGVMAQLDKTFPTNDCSMCIISPKLVEAGRHLNIELLTMSDIEDVSGEAGNFTVQVKKSPRYVDIEKCTACGECAKVCPVELPDAFDEGLGSKKAAFKLYPQAMPSAYAIEKGDRAPCKITCPAGLNVQGYVQMVKEGKYEQALRIIMEQLPLPGVLGRICPHECETACRRKEVDDPVAIRDLKRLAADRFDPRKLDIECMEKTGKRVAIAGSGPAGLSAAYHLARKGVEVTIFEALPRAGGMLRVGIPEHRLPAEVLDREIEVITNLGVEIRLDSPIGRDGTVESLLGNGYDAVYLAMGAHKGAFLNISGEELQGVVQGVDYLREMNLAGTVSTGKDVAIIGGGNVAIDVARSAVRLGAETVTVYYRRTSEEMPAWEEEVEAALEEGIEFAFLSAPVRINGKNGRVSGMTLLKMELTEPDKSGRRRPVPIEGSEFDIRTDQVIQAIGQKPDLSFIEHVQGIEMAGNGTVETDEITFETGIKGVFAGGDLKTGPATAIEAVACGMEAAESISRYLEGRDMATGRQNPKADQFEYPDIPEDSDRKERAENPKIAVEKRNNNFAEVEQGLDEEAGRMEAERCLNCGYCSECMECVNACLAEAVDHSMERETVDLDVGAIILAPGFSPFDPSQYDTYNYANHPDVVTSIEFERLLSASGPYQGHLVKPSDGKEPRKIAWLQCVGSRDINQCDHSYCSGVCCMYACKQAVISKEHSEKSLDTVIFFMDMRTHGKEFDKYAIRAEDESGVRFVRSRIHTVTPVPGGGLKIEYASEQGSKVEEMFDMVVLSVGMSPSKSAVELARKTGIELNSDRFAETGNLSPVAASREGIYVCGTFLEPKDIPGSVMEASAAAEQASNVLASQRWTLTRTKDLPEEQDFSEMGPRIGVFVCNCGINIGGIADVPAVRDYAANLEKVVHVEDNLFTCSQDSQDHLREVIVEKGINRVVVASCSPRTHEPLFQETIREAGLNRYLFEMANIRDQNTWVHMNEPEAATEKAKDLVRMAVAKVAHLEPLHQVDLFIKKAALVVGGGVSGLEAALSFADQGVRAFLVEKESTLGGVASSLITTWKGDSIKPYLESLIRRVEENQWIDLYLDTTVSSTTGTVGQFITTLKNGKTGEEERVEHGAVLMATGGREHKPAQYLYGQNQNVLTHLDMDKAFILEDERIDQAESVAFIQCVESRDNEHPYCSKICCTHSLKSAVKFKDLNPKTKVYILYRDIRSYGFRESLYKEAREKGVLFIRYEPDNPPSVSQSPDGKLELETMDHVLKMKICIHPDLLVLASGVVPNENHGLFEKFKIPVNEDGFLMEAHAKLRPVESAGDGVFVAGLAHYPKPVEESISQARAAVSRAMTMLSKDSVQVGGVVAEVDRLRCASCLTCVRTCPYGIPKMHPEGYAVIDPAECHGCGVCVAECPAKVIQLNHFTDDQIMAKTNALFEVMEN